ncbi:ribonuclease HII [Aerococcaceae bacterium DSM 111020]|nr:ribonuclease HII [Aerococcaceae bacterium DSM 111020]
MIKRTIKAIKEDLQEIESLEDPIWQRLSQDSRKGVQQAIKSRKRQINERIILAENHHKMLHYENALHEQGYQWIAGLDEVGRGPLAGPVVAAAVILPTDHELLMGVNDSKQLSLSQREQFAELIKQHALAYGIGVVDAVDIDHMNILQATKQAMTKAIDQLPITADYLLLDAMDIDASIPQQSIIKGDQRSLSIAAASILAKVYRDHLMIEYHQQYPEYQWDRNMGYGTAAHLQALEDYGAVEAIHRQSFKPVSAMKKRF